VPFESERTNVSLSVIRRTLELDRVCPRTRKLFLKGRGGEKQLLSRCGSTEQDAKRKGMPTILRKDGLRFFFFSREGTEPPHVHVEQAERYAKFWLEPVVLLEESRGFHSSELLRIHNLIEENRELFRLRWDEHFSQ
jgi:hypothetical protein